MRKAGGGAVRKHKALFRCVTTQFLYCVYIHIYIFLTSVCFVVLISESGHKQVLSSSSQNRPHPCPTEMSPSASYKIRESHIHKKEPKSVELKSSPRAQNAINLQESHQCSSSKKRKDKRKESPKENKTNESPAEMDSFVVSLEEIMKLFKPIDPCISPLPDSVRILPYLTWRISY